MPRYTTVMLVLGLSLVGATTFLEVVRATPAAGFSGTTLAVGRFDGFDVFNHTAPQRSAQNRGKDDDLDNERNDHRKNGWMSLQKTRGSSDLYLQSNLWTVGGTTGWHSHPGHSLITVTAGAVTVYDGDDPACTPHVYTVGMGFVDKGGDHIHVIRNEGVVEARTMVVQLIPANAVRRIDAATGNPACPF